MAQECSVRHLPGPHTGRTGPDLSESSRSSLENLSLWGGEDSNLRPADYESHPEDESLPAETAEGASQHWFHDSDDF